MSSYQARWRQFEDLDTHVLGISGDAVPSKAAWAEHLGGLSFDLLSDFYPHGAVTQQYGVLHPAGFPQRAIFLIDKQGRVAHSSRHDLPEQPDVTALIAEIEKLQAPSGRG